MVATGSIVQEKVVVGRELVRAAATGAPKRGGKLCHCLALTLGRLRWRGAVLAGWCGQPMGLQSAASVRSCMVDMRNDKLCRGQVEKVEEVLFG